MSIVQFKAPASIPHSIGPSTTESGMLPKSAKRVAHRRPQSSHKKRRGAVAERQPTSETRPIDFVTEASKLLGMTDIAQPADVLRELAVAARARSERAELGSAVAHMIGMSGNMTGKDDAFTFLHAMLYQTVDELLAISRTVTGTGSEALSALTYRLDSVVRIANVIAYGKASL